MQIEGQKWKDGQDASRKLGEEVAFGYTGFIYASPPPRHGRRSREHHIAAEDRPSGSFAERRLPVAGEARVALGLSPLEPSSPLQTPSENRPATSPWIR